MILSASFSVPCSNSLHVVQFRNKYYLLLSCRRKHFYSKTLTLSVLENSALRSLKVIPSLCFGRSCSGFTKVLEGPVDTMFEDVSVVVFSVTRNGEM